MNSKLNAVSLVAGQGYIWPEAVRSLSLHVTLLGRWVKEAQAGEGKSFEAMVD